LSVIMAEKRTLSSKLFQQIQDIGESKVLLILDAWRRKTSLQKKRYAEGKKVLKAAKEQVDGRKT